MSGWFAVWRRFEDHELWREPRVFSRAEAWIWILMKANWENKPATDGTMIERGCLLTSIRAMAHTWGWSKDRVRRFLTSLSNATQISQLTRRGRVILRVVNYDEYQNVIGDTTTRTSQRQVSKQNDRKTQHNNKQLTTNKEQEEGSARAGISFGEYFRADHEPYRKLLLEWGQEKVNYYTRAFNDYVAQDPSRLRKYKNHIATIRNWERRDASELKGFHAPKKTNAALSRHDASMAEVRRVLMEPEQ